MCNFLYYFGRASKSNPNPLYKDIKQDFLAALCGSTVITRYNNSTYRVDDVDFLMSPLSTFQAKDSEV